MQAIDFNWLMHRRQLNGTSFDALSQSFLLGTHRAKSQASRMLLWQCEKAAQDSCPTLHFIILFEMHHEDRLFFEKSHEKIIRSFI